MPCCYLLSVLHWFHIDVSKYLPVSNWKAVENYVFFLKERKPMQDKPELNNNANYSLLFSILLQNTHWFANRNVCFLNRSFGFCPRNEKKNKKFLEWICTVFGYVCIERKLNKKKTNFVVFWHVRFSNRLGGKSTWTFTNTRNKPI